LPDADHSLGARGYTLEGKIMIEAIRHTGIVVTEMGRALEFYRDLLGLEVVLDREQGGEFLAELMALEGVRMRVVMLQAPDGNKVELFEFHSHPKEAPGKVETSDIGCSHLAVAIDDLEAAYEELSQKGIQFNCPPVVSPDGYAKVAYCHDPDGTIVELVQILDTGKNPYAG